MTTAIIFMAIILICIEAVLVVALVVLRINRETGWSIVIGFIAGVVLLSIWHLGVRL